MSDEIYLSEIEELNSSEEVISWWSSEQGISGELLEAQQIPLTEMRRWIFDGHSIFHETGEFYTIQGFRIINSKTREVATGWDQPLITQVGYDGGVLGFLVRCQLSDVSCSVLCQLKNEPGNFGDMHISPSLQATFSNLNASHGGQRPNLADIFEYHVTDEVSQNLVLKKWLSEDGGRFYKKRNLLIVLRIKDDFAYRIPKIAFERFRWIRLEALSETLKQFPETISPHVRSYLAFV